MATILLARLVGPSDFQKHLVIKRIHDHLTADDETLNRFLDEARLAARVHHPNVVQIFEFDQHEGTYYIAMEYVHGENLADLYNHVRQDPSTGYHWGHAARVVAEAAAGLHAAHELLGGDGEPLRIVHRDVSPQNIMVSYDGHVKVADFGIAHAVGRRHNTVDGTVMGKVAYMSPEQCHGEVLDRRTDVFALGIVLYEMVCLRRLFRARSDQETMRRVLQCDFTPPRQVRPDLPPGLEQILLRALALRREDRYQTAAELQYAIEGLLAQEGALITASSLAALMGVVFHDEKLVKDRRIQRIYSRTFMEPPRQARSELPAAPEGSSGAGIPALASAGHSQDLPQESTPAHGASAVSGELSGKDQDRRSFGLAAGAPVVTEDQWGDLAPTRIDASPPAGVVSPTPPDVAAARPSGRAEPMVWPPGAGPESSPTGPVKRARRAASGRVRNLGATVDLARGPGVRAAASAPAAGVAREAFASGGMGGASPTTPEPGGGRGRLEGAGAGPDESFSGKSTAALLASVKGVPFHVKVAVGVGAVVVLGVLAGLTLTYFGNRTRRSEARATRRAPASEGAGVAAAMPGAKDDNMVTLTFELTPATAMLLVDGREIPGKEGSPLRTVRIPWQEAPLVVKALADGYRTEAISVIPEKDQRFEIRLHLLKGSPRTRRHAPRGSRRRFRRRRSDGAGAGTRQVGRPSRSDASMRPRPSDLMDPFSSGMDGDRRPFRPLRSGGAAAYDL